MCAQCVGYTISDATVQQTAPAAAFPVSIIGSTSVAMHSIAAIRHMLLTLMIPSCLACRSQQSSSTSQSLSSRRLCLALQHVSQSRLIFFHTLVRHRARSADDRQLLQDCLADSAGNSNTGCYSRSLLLPDYATPSDVGWQSVAHRG